MFFRVAPGLYEECVHLDSPGTCLGTYGLVAAKLLVPCQGYLVFLAPTPSLTLACLPACSQSSSGLCNNPPNQWSFPQAFVPCCILQSGREGPHGRGSHHPLYKSQPLPCCCHSHGPGGFLWHSYRMGSIVLEILIFLKKKMC